MHKSGKFEAWIGILAFVLCTGICLLQTDPAMAGRGKGKGKGNSG